jgi:probable HAF family extracellular repeat protein
MDNFSSPEFAYLYGGGTFQNLGTLPGYTTSVATGVNDATAAHPVQVVGDSTVPGFSSHAFVWDSTHGMQRLDSLSAIYGSNANGINASGQIVGSSGASAVLWQPNQATGGYVLTDLNSLLPSKSAWMLQAAYAINDMGQIVGYGTIRNTSHAFLLTPTTTAALAQPAASALATSTGGLAASTREQGVASLDFGKTNPTTLNYVTVSVPASVSSGLAIRTASVADPAPLVFSLLKGQQALPVGPVPAPATPSAPPASQVAVHPVSGTPSPGDARASDAIFAAFRTEAKDDGAWLFGPLFWKVLDAV